MYGAVRSRICILLYMYNRERERVASTAAENWERVGFNNNNNNKIVIVAGITVIIL